MNKKENGHNFVGNAANFGEESTNTHFALMPCTIDGSELQLLWNVYRAENTRIAEMKIKHLGKQQQLLH